MAFLGLGLALPAGAQLQEQLHYSALPVLPSRGERAVVGVADGRLVAVDGGEVLVLKSDRKGWEVVGELRGLAERRAAVSYQQAMVLTDGQRVVSIRLRGSRAVPDSIASLPIALSGVTGSVIDDRLYLAGVDHQGDGVFLVLDLRVASRGWVRLENWGSGQHGDLVSAALDGKLYMFGDRLAMCFEPGKGRWTPLASASEVAGPGPGLVMGLDHILLPGRRVTAYNAATHSFVDFGRLPANPASGSGFAAVKWGSEWAVVEGQHVFLLSKDVRFGWINWLTLALYLGAMVWMGFRYDRRGQTADTFFTAGGRIPWWAAGISIYGSQISAITFMAVPAVVFATDWSLMIGSLVLFAVVPIVTKYYIPFFRKLSVTSAYEYLEHRFSAPVRVLGSLSFILFQMGRMGIVLYLPATAIAAVTGMNIYILISIMGLICILYTVMGGIEAVVWTDVAQVIILIGGAVLCFFTAVLRTNGGLAGVVERGLQDGKFTMFRLGWSGDHLTLWVCVVGFFFLNLIPYSSDQTVVQRYLTVRDEKQAAKSLWVNAFVSLPGTFAFFGLGTVLYVFYRSHPGVIASDRVGEILPYFVVQQLPPGLSGLVIAGIFAASQSTLSASMNSISAAFFSDIYSKLRPGTAGGRTLRIARIVTICAGVFGAVSAMTIALLHIEFLFDLFQEVLGILGGSLAGVFILGRFTERTDARGAIAGLVAGFAVVWAVRSTTSVSVYLYGALSVLSCVVAGYAVSLLFPKKIKSIII